MTYGIIKSKIKIFTAEIKKWNHIKPWSPEVLMKHKFI